MEENPPPQNQDHGPIGYKIPAIRTYENDIAEAAAGKKISSASIAIAEADRKRGVPATADQAIAQQQAAEPKQPEPANIRAPGGPSFISPITIAVAPTQPKTQSSIPESLLPPTQPKPTPQQNQPEIKPQRVINSGANRSGSGIKTFLKIFLSLLLIGGGLGAGYYFYIISPLSKQTSVAIIPQTTTLIPGIVTPDTQKDIMITGKKAPEIISSITQVEKNGSAQSTGIQELIFTSASSTDSTQRVSAPEFISAIGLNPPDAFTSSLKSSWMFGVDSSNNAGNGPFIIFTTNFFQNTFAGMLAWEPTLPEDLSQVFGFPISTSGIYEDRILNNKNIREFVNASGTPVYLYGFLDNQKLLITKNEATFSDIVNRIEKQTYIR